MYLCSETHGLHYIVLGVFIKEVGGARGVSPKSMLSSSARDCCSWSLTSGRRSTALCLFCLGLFGSPKDTNINVD